MAQDRCFNSMDSARFGRTDARESVGRDCSGREAGVFAVSLPFVSDGGASEEFKKEWLMSKSKSEGTERRCRIATAGAVTACALSFGAGGAAAADCASLAAKTFGDVTITAATSAVPPSSVAGIEPLGPVPITAPMCRVQGSIKASADSDITFEVWLPPEAAWNGRYEGVGNGGFAGYLVYRGILLRGFHPHHRFHVQPARQVAEGLQRH